MIKISYNIIRIQILIYVEKIIIIHRMHILDGNVVRTLIWILPVWGLRHSTKRWLILSSVGWKTVEEWRIYIDRFWMPLQPSFLHFHAVFGVWPNNRMPLWRWGALWEILDPPLCNQIGGGRGEQQRSWHQLHGIFHTISENMVNSMTFISSKFNFQLVRHFLKICLENINPTLIWYNLVIY